MTIKQTSLAELHRLNITLSNYFDVAPRYHKWWYLIRGHQKLKRQSPTKSKRVIDHNLSIPKEVFPFWIWDQEKIIGNKPEQLNGNCCTQHVLGLPVKNGKANSRSSISKSRSLMQ